MHVIIITEAVGYFQTGYIRVNLFKLVGLRKSNKPMNRHFWEGGVSDNSFSSIPHSFHKSWL